MSRYFVESAIAKHRTRIDVLFFKAVSLDSILTESASLHVYYPQVIAGVFLSFGGLLSEVIAGGSPALTASNPGLVKILAGFVFPVGLVMCVPTWLH